MKKIINNEYLHIGLTAFIIFGITIIPAMVFTGGKWIYYGDFNVQQIPFYIHAHDAVRSGRLFYDWGVDLGGSLLGCFSFYLCGSPFFWLTLPSDSHLIPYLMPWLAVLKYTVMALCAYAYAKKHLSTRNGAFIAALLYTFSGFNGAVLVYNHFHEVFAFFPLYLLLFECAMEEKKRLSFILMTSFMAILNYYFFVGEAVFLVIYFVTRYLFMDKTFKEKLILFLRALYCGVTGVMLAGIYLLPAVYYTLHSSRVSDTLLGYDLLAYHEPMAILAIIKNVVMLPDLSGLNSMYNLSFSRVSGVAGYIPLFSVAFVGAFFAINKGKKMWEKRLVVTCAVFAGVPLLNAVFSAMNNEYYARWFYMPLLIMSVMTASLVETRAMRAENKSVFIRSTVVVACITAFISLTALLPAENSDGERTILGALKNPEQLITEIAFSVAMLAFLLIYILLASNKKDIFTKCFVIGACFATSVTMMISGLMLVDMDRKNGFINQALTLESPLYDEEGFYRIETEEDVYNYPLMWEAHSITSFISTIPSSTIDFYTGFGIRRKVTSNLSSSKVGMKTFLSGKYFLKENETAIERIGRVEDMETMKGYEYREDRNGFSIYENTNFLPMGFCFDSYITEQEFEEADYSTTSKDRLPVRTLVLDEDTAAKFDDILVHEETDSFKQASYQEFVKACDARRETACEEFNESTNGFTATYTAECESVMLFSVPYENGFTAYVDGNETEISVADYGFMIIRVPEGHHEIEFMYTLSDYRYGKILSVGGAVSLLFVLPVINVCGIFIDKKKKEKEIA